jgi:hypothetical protein
VLLLAAAPMRPNSSEAGDMPSSLPSRGAAAAVLVRRSKVEDGVGRTATRTERSYTTVTRCVKKSCTAATRRRLCDVIILSSILTNTLCAPPSSRLQQHVCGAPASMRRACISTVVDERVGLEAMHDGRTGGHGCENPGPSWSFQRSMPSGWWKRSTSALS